MVVYVTEPRAVGSEKGRKQSLSMNLLREKGGTAETFRPLHFAKGFLLHRNFVPVFFYVTKASGRVPYYIEEKGNKREEEKQGGNNEQGIGKDLRSERD